MIRIVWVWLMLLLSSLAMAEGDGGDTGSGDSGLLSGLTAWLLTYINKVIAVINAFIQNIWNTIVDFTDQLIETLYDMLTDVLIRFFSLAMDLVITVIQGLDVLFEQIDITNFVSGLPTEVLNMMGLIGLGRCLGIIGVACIIRITMQLIPFTRLGS